MKITVQLTIEISDEWAAEDNALLERRIESLLESEHTPYADAEIIERADS